jgi:hypothetical protein
LRLDRVTGLANNELIVRKVVAIALALAVHIAALSAPLVHAHPDDHATGHHGGRAVHSHWAGHSHSAGHSDAPAIGPEDHDRAVFLAAFIAVAASRLDAPGVARAVFALPVPVETIAHLNVQVTHGHDPPFFVSLPARAPPAFLS